MPGAGLYLFLIAALVAASSQALQLDEMNNSNATERSLSRKRRYLVFPSGSSLQLGQYVCVIFRRSNSIKIETHHLDNCVALISWWGASNRETLTSKFCLLQCTVWPYLRWAWVRSSPWGTPQLWPGSCPTKPNSYLIWRTRSFQLLRKPQRLRHYR